MPVHHDLRNRLYAFTPRECDPSDSPVTLSPFEDLHSVVEYLQVHGITGPLERVDEFTYKPLRSGLGLDRESSLLALFWGTNNYGAVLPSKPLSRHELRIVDKYITPPSPKGEKGQEFKGTPPVVYCDLDGVLVDHIPSMLKLFDAPWKKSQQKEWSIVPRLGITEEEFWRVIKEAGADFWAEMPMEPGGQKIWDMLLEGEKRGDFHLLLLSATHGCPTIYEGKQRWIHDYLGKEHTHRLVPADGKHQFAHARAFLIDDCEEQIAKFEEHHGTGCLVPQPWNRLGRKLTAREKNFYALLVGDPQRFDLEETLSDFLSEDRDHNLDFLSQEDKDEWESLVEACRTLWKEAREFDEARVAFQDTLRRFGKELQAYVYQPNWPKSGDRREFT